MLTAEVPCRARFRARSRPDSPAPMIAILVIVSSSSPVLCPLLGSDRPASIDALDVLLRRLYALAGSLPPTTQDQLCSFRERSFWNSYRVPTGTRSQGRFGR